MANQFATDRQRYVEDEQEIENGDAMPMPSVYYRNGKPAAMPRYTHKDYPRVKYHADKAPITVIDAEDEKSLGAGWSNAPIRNVDGDTRAEPRRTR